MPRLSCFPFAILALSITPALVVAAEPTLRGIDLRGLQIGGTTTLTIEGDELGKSPRLLMPFNAKHSLKPGSTDKKAVFDVTLPGDVDAGYYQLRVVTDGGVSLPVVVGVDRLRQQLATEAIKELPVALHGTVTGSTIVEAKFQGKAKQRVLVEVEAQRLGSKLKPIVHLYTAKKLQLAWSWGTTTLFGDARLEATLPEDGTYFVTLHDAEYAAGVPGFFRLKVGELSHVDQVFPPVIAKGQPWSVSLLGSTVSPQITVTAPKYVDVLPLPWPEGTGVWSGPRPFVTISPHAEYVELPDTGKLQEIPAGPAGISGRLLKPYEEDRYRVAVTPGKKVRLEVFAERIGSPIDCALVVRNDQDAQLARAEDSPGTLDPVLEYTVPAKVTSIVVGVIDAQGRGGPRGIYRLVIDPGGSKDGFKLTTTTQRLTLASGGRAVLPVQVDRRGGFQGKIDLALDRDIPGIKLQGALIPAGAEGALVTIERTGSPLDAAITSLRGRTEDGTGQLVLVKAHPFERLQPWLASEIAIAPNNASSEFAVDWHDLKTDPVLSLASKLLLPVKLTRPVEKTTVRLTLLTSQILNNPPDPNKSIRQDKSGELAATVTTGDVTVVVPPELSGSSYDVTVQAELLDPAKKVVATAFAPVRRLQVLSPIVVKLDGPDRIETPFDAKKGAAVKLQGKLERREGLKADVAITVTGLPAGAKADAVTVKENVGDFSVNILLPPNVTPGEISGLKLFGSYAPDGKAPNVRVKSREVELTLVLKASK